MTEVTPGEWVNYLVSCPEAHILQTREWGDLKSDFGWRAKYIICERRREEKTIGAQILFRELPLGLSAAYIGKGPVTRQHVPSDLQDWDPLWRKADELCRHERAIFLKIEPDIWQSSFETGRVAGNGSALKGFQPSPHAIQPNRTLVVSLDGSEEDILARMKQKTRYNIRLAVKKGVVVYPSENLDTFYRLMTLTSDRDAFGVHTPGYYQRAFELFSPHDRCVMLISEFQNQPLAALMAFRHGSRAWYFYGASGNDYRELMPTYLLQWEAMRWARQNGCQSYDLWGIPDVDEEELERDFPNRSGGLWGVYRFKRGFGGQMMRSVGAWDRVYQPLLYTFYRWWYGSRAEA